MAAIKHRSTDLHPPVGTVSSHSGTFQEFTPDSNVSKQGRERICKEARWIRSRTPAGSATLGLVFYPPALLDRVDARQIQAKCVDAQTQANIQRRFSSLQNMSRAADLSPPDAPISACESIFMCGRMKMKEVTMDIKAESGGDFVTPTMTSLL